MVEIEDRDMIFKSYKLYARFLEFEVKKLQQLLSSNEIKSAYSGAKRDFMLRWN